MSILDSFSNLPDQPEIAPYRPARFGEVVMSSLYGGSQRTEFGIVPTLETSKDYIDRQNKLKQRFTQDELKSIQGDDKELRNEALRADAEKGVTFYQGYTPDINPIRNKRIDDAILTGREQDPRWSDIKTTEEIQEQKKNRARAAINSASEISSRASGFDSVAGSLVGGLGAAFTDPINIATLPFGATSGMGILKAMKAEAILNAGVEAVEAPFVAKWQKELGFKYGIGDTALDIGTAGLAGAGFAGIVKGVRPTAEAFGRLFDRSAKYTKGKSLPILQKISDSENLPTAVKDAAKYMSRVAHIDEEVPSRQGLNGEIRTDVSGKDIVQHRQTLQDTQDAFDNYREPVFDRQVVNNMRDYSDSDLFEQYRAVSTELNQLPKPKGLLQFIKESGGIRDEAGELANYGITTKSYPGLLRRDGQNNSIDYARERAVEAGYLPDETTTSDFLEAVREDFVNRNVFDEQGQSINMQRGNLEDGLRQLDEHFGNKGINLRDEATVKRFKLEAKLKKQEAGIRKSETRPFEIQDGRIKDIYTKNPNLIEEENYSTNLGNYTDNLFREVDPQDVLKYLPTNQVVANMAEDIYFANSKYLALGQKENSQGIILGFNSEGIRGKFNTNKPTWKFLLNNGEAEFVAKLNDQNVYQNNLNSISIPNDLKINPKFGERLNKGLNILEENGWTKIKSKQETIYSKNQAFDGQVNSTTSQISGAEKDLVFKPNDALASMERDVADLDSLGEDVYNADFERLLKEQPDLEIETPEGRMTIREIADQIKEDDNILSAIKTCAIG
jgi:hypothetical protein